MSDVTEAGKLIAQGLPPDISGEPLWKGPEVDGITQSLLSKFLVCRERFRLLTVLGLQSVPVFNHRIEYGSMFHVCEEHDTLADSFEHLDDYMRGLAVQYPTARDQIAHWWRVCRVQYPIYKKFWAERSNKTRKWKFREQSFAVIYTLPSGRRVKLRGKWDGLFSVPTGLWLRENKTKGDIREDLIVQQLRFDLQVMFYMIALLKESPSFEETFEGVEYNVVRRPLSGGKDSIRRHKATKNKPEESHEAFYGRLGGLIEDHPEHYFMRWDVVVSRSDVARFLKCCLNPILEQLCDWWEQVSTCPDPFRNTIPSDLPGLQIPNRSHWIHPFGVYNPLNEGRATELDHCIETGSTQGLVRAKTLFPELAE